MEQIVLSNKKTKVKIAIKLINHDETAGWFGENIEGKKRWYSPLLWEYIKEVGE